MHPLAAEVPQIQRDERAALDCWEPRVDAGDGGQARDELSGSQCFDDRVVFGGRTFW